MSMRDDAMYRVNHRLELTRRRLMRWNRVEVGDIFRKVEEVETSIVELQMREDRDGSVSADDLSSLRANLSIHHSLLR